MKKNRILIALVISCLTSCDPVHSLKLDNQTSKPVVVIYSPLIDIASQGSNVEEFDIEGVTYAKTVLESGQYMRIGTVIASYTPRPYDIKLDFLEVYIDEDTMRLIGRKSIFCAIQKVGKLDWRLIIKDK